MHLIRCTPLMVGGVPRSLVFLAAVFALTKTATGARDGAWHRYVDEGGNTGATNEPVTSFLDAPQNAFAEEQHFFYEQTDVDQDGEDSVSSSGAAPGGAEEQESEELPATRPILYTSTVSSQRSKPSTFGRRRKNAAPSQEDGRSTPVTSFTQKIIQNKSARTSASSSSKRVAADSTQRLVGVTPKFFDETTFLCLLWGGLLFVALFRDGQRFARWYWKGVEKEHAAALRILRAGTTTMLVFAFAGIVMHFLLADTEAGAGVL